MEQCLSSSSREEFRKTHLEIWRQKGAIEPDHMWRINVESQEHRHTLAEQVYVSMVWIEIYAPELIVAEEVKGHQRLDVLDPSALVIQCFITDICHSHSLDTRLNFSFLKAEAHQFKLLVPEQLRDLFCHRHHGQQPHLWGWVKLFEPICQGRYLTRPWAAMYTLPWAARVANRGRGTSTVWRRGHIKNITEGSGGNTWMRTLGSSVLISIDLERTEIR